MRVVHLLLVEDDPGDARLVQALVRSARDLDVHVEDRLERAVSHLGAHEVDLVLLDLGLPDSRGLETVRAVRRQAPHVPIVVLTGHDDEETGEAAIREGAEDYVTKGQVASVVLVRAIRHALERHEHLGRAEHLAKVLRAIRGVNRLAASEAEPERLIEQACDLLVREHGFPAVWIALAREGDGRFAREGLAALREQLWLDLGVRVPPIAVRQGALAPGGWTLLVDDVPAGAGSAPASEAVALVPPDELALVGIDAAPDRDPISGRTVSLVHARDADRAARLGPVRGPLDRVLSEVLWALARSAHQLVGVQEVQALLDALEPGAPALVREASRQLPPATLAEVLRRLVEEGVSIRPLRTILEALLEAGSERRPAALAEASRRALRRHIGHRCAGGGPLTALLLDPHAEEAVRSALAGEALALDPVVAAALLDALGEQLRALEDPPVVLASPDVRRALRSLLAPRFPRIAVLAYEELPPELPIRPIGRLALVA